jgi:hypothetical protein
MKMIDREVDAWERVATGNLGTSGAKRPTRDPPTVAALLSPDPSFNCVYREQNHPPSQCRNVIDVKARKQVLLRAGCCFVCLKKGHVGKNCCSPLRCSSFKKKAP